MYTRFYVLLCLGSLGIFAAAAQPDSIMLKDIQWNTNAPAKSTELFIPSGASLLAGLIYQPNGNEKHPTLLLLHGYPGNERNLDIAQVVRAHGWNVIYFDYRGSWGSQGKFSFTNCVEDVVNVVAFCHRYSDSLHIDTANIALFGHSMGGWVCLQALARLPAVKKGFALSTWNIGLDFKKVMNAKERIDLIAKSGNSTKYFVLNTSLSDLFGPVMTHPERYEPATHAALLAKKSIVMLDEHHRNEVIATAIRAQHPADFDYEVWNTDHPFSNKRVSLMNKVLAFLEK